MKKLRSDRFGWALLLVCVALPSGALACIVGTGTTASCSESALNECLPGGGSFDGTVTFSCGGAATITVTSMGTISADTTIDGGSVITISGGHTVGIWNVNPAIKFTAQNLTIANGSWRTGVIYSLGILTINNSIFTGNTYSGAAGFGGAICNAGTAVITNSTFVGNSSSAGDGAGGGICNQGTLTVINSTFSGNSALYGGAIFNQGGGGTATVISSTFSANSAGRYGGGIDNDGAVTITNSTFSSNSAEAGGGIYNDGQGPLTVTNSTFSSNSAGSGSGIYNLGGNNIPVTITNTIVANGALSGNCVGSVTDGGHNIDDGRTCGLSAASGSLTNTNPNLDPAGLSSGLIHALKLWKLGCPKGSYNLVFPNMDGSPRHRTTITYATLRPALKAAGLRQVSLHSLRHTCASTLILSGVDCVEVAKFLGHANATVTTTIYAHWFNTRKTVGTMAAVAGAVFGPARETLEAAPDKGLREGRGL